MDSKINSWCWADEVKKLERRVAELEECIKECLTKNAHLADGDACSLIDLKKEVPEWEVVFLQGEDAVANNLPDQRKMKIFGFGADLSDVLGDEKNGKCICGRNLTETGWCHRCSKFTRRTQR